VLALALLSAPVAAQESTAPDCTAIAAERSQLRVEHASVKRDIADIATGRYGKRKRKPVSSGAVAKGAAGTAASLLLPFPLGIAVGAAGAAATKKKKDAAPADPGPDVDAMIARQQAIEARLSEISVHACP
jgi:hypothetical protein